MSPQPETTQEIVEEPIVLDGFGDDALGRVRGLLFGDHAQRTNERIDVLEQTISRLIDELQASFDRQINGLSKALEQEVQERHEAVADLGCVVVQEVKTLTKADAALGRKLDKGTENLRGRIGQVREKAASELAAARDQLAADVAQQAQVLQENKVDRSSLGALLRATARDIDGVE